MVAPAVGAPESREEHDESPWTGGGPACQLWDLSIGTFINLKEVRGVRVTAPCVRKCVCVYMCTYGRTCICVRTSGTRLLASCSVMLCKGPGSRPGGSEVPKCHHGLS